MKLSEIKKLIKEELQGNSWEKFTIDDVKKSFPNKSFTDGGMVDDSYSKSESIIIPDVNTAVEILKFLDKKMYPYGIGGNPEDIKKVWDRFPNSTVKMALPKFDNKRYNQIISFVFDDGSENPPVFAYHSNYTESPYIWKRLSKASWQIWGKDELDKFFKKHINEEASKKPYVNVMYDKPFDRTTIQGRANDGYFKGLTVKGNYKSDWEKEYKDDDISTAIRKIKNSLKRYQILNVMAEGKFGVVIDGKQVDIGSIELEDVFGWDRPDFADAYASSAQFEDGTELTDTQLEELTDKYSDIINMIANGIN